MTRTVFVTIGLEVEGERDDESLLPEEQADELLEWMCSADYALPTPAWVQSFSSCDPVQQP